MANPATHTDHKILSGYCLHNVGITCAVKIWTHREKRDYLVMAHGLNGLCVAVSCNGAEVLGMIAAKHGDAMVHFGGVDLRTSLLDICIIAYIEDYSG